MLLHYSVRPPKKSWKNISNLSGGEKTLSSLALVFALHHFKPTPLYVMDEIDAALDFKNVSIVANYIKVRVIYCHHTIFVKLTSCALIFAKSFVNGRTLIIS
jgi:ABC-type iron transport system FetAB ATPase subunit